MLRSSVQIRTLIFTTILASVITPALSNTVYVDNSGGNCNGGALSPCYGTIQEGVNAVDLTGGGAVVNVMPGFYDEGVNLDTMNGGTTGSITVQAVNAGGAPTPGTVTVNGGAMSAFRTNKPFSGSAFAGTIALVGFQANSVGDNGISLWDVGGDVRLTDITANNSGDDGIDVADVSGDVRILGCTANTNADDGVDIESVGGEIIINNTVANGNLDSSDGDGFDIACDCDVTITNSTADNNAEEGIDLEVARAVTITSCNANGNGGSGIDLDDPNGNVRIEDSRASGNLEGIEIYSDSPTAPGTTIVYCNDIQNNALGLDIFATSGSTVNASRNWWGSPTGPSGAGYSGSGDSIVTAGLAVNASDWLTTPRSPDACEAPIPPKPTAVPTLHQWGTVLMVLVLAALGMLAMRRHLK